MNFTEALTYVFNARNIPKILTIVLIAIIIGVSVLVVGLALESWAVLLILIPVLLGYALFVQGYTISIIKSVLNGEETMPSISFGRDLGRGAVVMIAGIVYAIPMILFFACGFMLIGFLSGDMSGTSSDEAALTGLLMFCGMAIAFIFFYFVLFYSLIVGQIRYAAEDSAGALFNMGKNFGIVMSNLGKTLGLFARLFAITIVFGIFSNVILNVVSAFFSGVTNDLIFELSNENYNAIAELGMPLALYASITYIVSLTIGLMQAFSGAHLMAGFGNELGYGDKLKNDETGGSGMTIVFVLIAIFFLIVLVAVVTIVVLALLGPTIGNVFSDVITGFEP